MRALYIVCSLLFLLGNVNAQTSEETLFNRSNIRMSGNWFAFGYQFVNFGEGEWTPMRGINLGLEFNRELFIGVARYSSRDQINLVLDDPTYSFRYSGLLLAISPAATRWIHPRFGLTAGPARVWRNSEEGDDRLFVFQPHLGLEFNVFQFARLGLEGGYRFAGQSNTYGLTKDNLSAPFILAELRFGISWADDE